MAEFYLIIQFKMIENFKIKLLANYDVYYAYIWYVMYIAQIKWENSSVLIAFVGFHRFIYVYGVDVST